MKAKPCPWCGTIGVDIVEGSTERWLVAECPGCGSRGPEVRRVSEVGQPLTNGDKELALTAWETRHD